MSSSTFKLREPGVKRSKPKNQTQSLKDKEERNFQTKREEGNFWASLNSWGDSKHDVVKKKVKHPGKNIVTTLPNRFPGGRLRGNSWERDLRRRATSAPSRELIASKTTQNYLLTRQSNSASSKRDNQHQQNSTKISTSLREPLPFSMVKAPSTPNQAGFKKTIIKKVIHDKGAAKLETKESTRAVITRRSAFTPKGLIKKETVVKKKMKKSKAPKENKDKVSSSAHPQISFEQWHHKAISPDSSIKRYGKKSEKQNLSHSPETRAEDTDRSERLLSNKVLFISESPQHKKGIGLVETTDNSGTDSYGGMSSGKPRRSQPLKPTSSSWSGSAGTAVGFSKYLPASPKVQREDVEANDAAKEVTSLHGHRRLHPSRQETYGNKDESTCYEGFTFRPSLSGLSKGGVDSTAPLHSLSKDTLNAASTVFSLEKVKISPEMSQDTANDFSEYHTAKKNALGSSSSIQTFRMKDDLPTQKRYVLETPPKKLRLNSIESKPSQYGYTSPYSSQGTTQEETSLQNAVKNSRKYWVQEASSAEDPVNIDQLWETNSDKNSDTSTWMTAMETKTTLLARQCKIQRKIIEPARDITVQIEQRGISVNSRSNSVVKRNSSETSQVPSHRGRSSREHTNHHSLRRDSELFKHKKSPKKRASSPTKSSEPMEKRRLPRLSKKRTSSVKLETISDTGEGRGVETQCSVQVKNKSTSTKNYRSSSKLGTRPLCGSQTDTATITSQSEQANFLKSNTALNELVKGLVEQFSKLNSPTRQGGEPSRNVSNTDTLPLNLDFSMTTGSTIQGQPVNETPAAKVDKAAKGEERPDVKSCSVMNQTSSIESMGVRGTRSHTRKIKIRVSVNPSKKQVGRITVEEAQIVLPGSSGNTKPENANSAERFGQTKIIMGEQTTLISEINEQYSKEGEFVHPGMFESRNDTVCEQIHTQTEMAELEATACEAGAAPFHLRPIACSSKTISTIIKRDVVAEKKEWEVNTRSSEHVTDYRSVRRRDSRESTTTWEDAVDSSESAICQHRRLPVTYPNLRRALPRSERESTSESSWTSLPSFDFGTAVKMVPISMFLLSLLYLVRVLTHIFTLKSESHHRDEA